MCKADSGAVSKIRVDTLTGATKLRPLIPPGEMKGFRLGRYHNLKRANIQTLVRGIRLISRGTHRRCSVGPSSPWFTIGEGSKKGEIGWFDEWRGVGGPASVPSQPAGRALRINDGKNKICFSQVPQSWRLLSVTPSWAWQGPKAVRQVITSYCTAQP